MHCLSFIKLITSPREMSSTASCSTVLKYLGKSLSWLYNCYYLRPAKQAADWIWLSFSFVLFVLFCYFFSCFVSSPPPVLRCTLCWIGLTINKQYGPLVNYKFDFDFSFFFGCFCGFYMASKGSTYCTGTVFRFSVFTLLSLGFLPLFVAFEPARSPQSNPSKRQEK